MLVKQRQHFADTRGSVVNEWRGFHGSMISVLELTL
jgi:hypothetical protein